MRFDTRSAASATDWSGSWLDSVEGAVRTRRTALSRSAGQLSSAAAQARPGPRRCRQGQAVDTFMIVSRASCARAA